MAFNPFPPPGEPPRAYHAGTSAGMPSAAPGYPYATLPSAPGTPPPPSGNKGRTGLIVAVVILAVLLGLTVIGIILFIVLGAAVSTWVMTDESDNYELTTLGTLPQAVAGEPYAAEPLLGEVKRELDNLGSTYSGLECDPIKTVAKDATTTCEGTIDDMSTVVKIRMEDEAGHFTMTQRW